MKNPFIALCVLSMAFLQVHSTQSSCEEGHPKIVSSHCEEMMTYIAQFPFSEYRVRKVLCYGYVGRYYIDPIEDHIKNFLAKGYSWEKHISRLIKQYAIPGSKVLDIGAHIGTHSLTMAQYVGAKGQVHSFEPQPKIFRELFLNMQLNELKNTICHWAAVGAENGTIETSFLAPLNEGGTSLIAPKITLGTWSYNVLGGTGIFVDLVTIDSLHLENVSLIKIDAEGMENAVLDGARETILRNKPVIILEIMGGWTLETAPAEVVEQIEFSKQKVRNLGYELTRIAAWDYLAIPKQSYANDN